MLFRSRRQEDAWWPKLKPSGIYCGHDYIDSPRPGNGVKTAVDGFCEREALRVGVEPDKGFPEWWVGGQSGRDLDIKL